MQILLERVTTEVMYDAEAELVQLLYSEGPIRVPMTMSRLDGIVLASRILELTGAATTTGPALELVGDGGGNGAPGDPEDGHTKSSGPVLEPPA